MTYTHAKYITYTKSKYMTYTQAKYLTAIYKASGRLTMLGLKLAVDGR